jgi:hypothetical protein
MQWETVIGLEVHVQLATKTKIFSGASTAFGAEPNTQACAIDLALPGTLPVANEQAFRFATMFGLAVNAEIGKRSVFERKIIFIPICLKVIKPHNSPSQLSARALLIWSWVKAAPNAFAFTTHIWKKMPENRCTKISPA